LPADGHEMPTGQLPPLAVATAAGRPGIACGPLHPSTVLAVAELLAADSVDVVEGDEGKAGVILVLEFLAEPCGRVAGQDAAAGLETG
jgi:hypothetical protein